MLGNIMNLKKSKFVVLDEILRPMVDGKGETVHFYVDVHALVKSLYTPSSLKIFDSLSDGKDVQDVCSELASELLNIAGHYRRYCATRLGKRTAIYFYYTYDRSKLLTEVHHEYKKKLYEKYKTNINEKYSRMNRILIESLKIAKLVGEYIPNIYFIDSKHLEPNVVPYHFIENMNDEQFFDTDLVISNDELNWQMANHFGVYVLTTKGAYSSIITSDDLIDLFLGKNADAVDHQVSNDFYSYFYALKGHSQYSVKGIPKYGAKRTVELLKEAVHNKIIPNTRIDDFQSLTDTLIEGKLLPREYGNVVNTNFQLLDIPTAYSRISEDEKALILDSQVVDRHDLKERNRLVTFILKIIS
ncbi:hypothetical protein QA612_04670 [Evansella sp. AB-P1]|uniref:hypothetical protein n=1 Tax=Evansella sp. AB-P1 TaxID=3037653 RepID=UPI00241FE5AF|nr:hypothetical protein [Evansella sp. AB-P1]MDG5786775.1 hypothetical protein [Evansella sp. AB-P1]